ncbi:hypothetical protein Gogos_017881 [Gossypium gossypioides]|uniref:CCHC-type domain-containing protein n=1 Tax=Gossypium gossypioides TaxID=34282 RepID=A0A7J9BCE2_GOSGO|nr:hypothetical protein [Gossypium gossypioides]
MVIFVNLDKPLTSKILINGNLQRIEYESLSSICFSCGQYGHVKELCLISTCDKDLTRENERVKMAKSIVGVTVEDTTEFSPWMVVKRHPARVQRNLAKRRLKIWLVLNGKPMEK